MPQSPELLFLKKTIREDFLTVCRDPERTEQMAEMLGISALLDCHPYDVSGGELQRAAIGKLLLAGPEALFLDEPTKGLDGSCKAELGALLEKLAETGMAVFCVSHDLEFCARYAQRCGLLFDGQIITEGTSREFFSGNSFYTTAANRIGRGLFRDAVSCEEVIGLCQKNLEEWH